MMITEHVLSSTRLEQLRKSINDKDYLYVAIQRIALVLSNELAAISQGGEGYHEQQRKRRR